MLVPYSSILKKIRPGKWALPTCNTFDLEVTMAILKAAEDERSPIAIEISERSLEHGGGEVFVQAVANYADKVRVPVALHYDHGTSLLEIKRALTLPFSSVMVAYDVSASLASNIRRAQSIVKIAKKKRISVQGEVGHVTGPKDNWRLPKAWLTDPDKAAEYVEQTNVDALSVSVGNRHGIASGSVKLEWDLIKKLRKKLDVPLVLHGGSGLRAPSYVRAVKAGISVFNFDTDLRFAYGRTLGRTLDKQRDLIDPRLSIRKARKAVSLVVQKKVRSLGANGKA